MCPDVKQRIFCMAESGKISYTINHLLRWNGFSTVGGEGGLDSANTSHSFPITQSSQCLVTEAICPDHSAWHGKSCDKQHVVKNAFRVVFGICAMKRMARRHMGASVWWRDAFWIEMTLFIFFHLDNNAQKEKSVNSALLVNILPYHLWEKTRCNFPKVCDMMYTDRHMLKCKTKPTVRTVPESYHVSIGRTPRHLQLTKCSFKIQP